jgi:hypothetical protein
MSAEPTSGDGDAIAADELVANLAAFRRHLIPSTELTEEP